MRAVVGKQGTNGIEEFHELGDHDRLYLLDGGGRPILEVSVHNATSVEVRGRGDWSLLKVIPIVSNVVQVEADL